MRRSRRIVLAAALAVMAGAADAADPPGRVVSMNLCTDQVALLLAAPGQLVSVSHVARDPLTSAMAAEAAEVPVNNGRAEEIFRLEPDLVLAGPWSDPVALGLLSDLGVSVAVLPVVESLDGIADTLRQAGRVLGRDNAAEAAARAVEARLAALPLAEDRPLAAFFYANGYSLGPGTLAHDILTRAGFRNLAEVLGRPGGGRLSLEDLILNRPDLIVTSAVYAGASEAEAIMDHPALADIPRAVSGADWVCGTPRALDAVDRLIGLRLRLSD